VATINRLVRCPQCYFRLRVAGDADVSFELEMHRLSGDCRAHVPPKDRTPRKSSKSLQPDHSLSRLDTYWGDF
jgi:hypothetical protein